MSAIVCIVFSFTHMCLCGTFGTMEKGLQVTLIILSADSYGHKDPDMVPFWHLGWLAASFVMLKESNENTLYNMAQVSKINQLVRTLGQIRL